MEKETRSLGVPRVALAESMLFDSTDLEKLEEKLEEGEKGPTWRNEIWARYILVAVKGGEIKDPYLTFFEPILEPIYPVSKFVMIANPWFVIRVCPQKALSHLGLAGFTARELEKRFGWGISFNQGEPEGPICLCYDRKNGEPTAQLLVGGYLWIDFKNKMLIVRERNVEISPQEPSFPYLEEIAAFILDSELRESGWEAVRVPVRLL
jgi:hypothetical protein